MIRNSGVARIPFIIVIAMSAMSMTCCAQSESDTTTVPDTSAPSKASHASTDKEPAVDLESRNRLGEQTSPYLLQHQHNPVHWWPWGPEAFAAAREFDRPIFLSVGYSTCYWCHVMERESFENDDVAAVMNEHFICIKVDREERPDVDSIYMVAVNLLNQVQGGWPMSVFLDPVTLKPFFGGTYFPPEDRYGRPGFTSVLTRIAELWGAQRSDITTQAERVADAIEQHLAGEQQSVELDDSHVQLAVSQLLSTYDRTDGGFGRGRNKFPVPANINFLMDAAWDVRELRAAVLHTLDRMAIGGMYDQVGGGFHRYSTDTKWLVPHFEKMLYDNGQLASTYAEAFERTDDAFYAQIVRGTLEYVLREMVTGSGAFASAQDAEVNHMEGENYLWTADQIRATLSAAGLESDIDFTLDVYGFNAGTNFKDPHHPDSDPVNVIFLRDRPDRLAIELSLTDEVFAERMERINTALLAVRDQRDQPITDDKILTEWNGMMITGFADGGRVLGEQRYIDAAERAAESILNTMRDEHGALLRTAREGRTAPIPGFLEDYAWMIHGLCALHRATDDPKHLDSAIELAHKAKDLFWDDANGAYFDTLDGQSDLFVRAKTTYDGASPSGNGVMLLNLLYLLDASGEDAWRAEAAAAMDGVSADVAKNPTSTVAATRALKQLLALSAGEETPRPAPAVAVNSASPIHISCDQSLLQLADGATARVEITMTLGEGFHMNSHTPGDAYLVPLEITMLDGDGVSMTVDYPVGEQFAGPLGAMNVHHGVVTVPLTFTRTGRIIGRPTISITHQICTDQACLEPNTVALELEILESSD